MLLLLRELMRGFGFGARGGSLVRTELLENEDVPLAAAFDVRPRLPAQPPTARICFVARFGVPSLGGAERPAPGERARACCFSVLNLKLCEMQRYVYATCGGGSLAVRAWMRRKPETSECGATRFGLRPSL